MTFSKFLLILLLVYVVYYAFVILTDKSLKPLKQVDNQTSEEDFEDDTPISSESLISNMEAEFRAQRNSVAKSEREIDLEINSNIQQVHSYTT